MHLQGKRHKRNNNNNTETYFLVKVPLNRKQRMLPIVCQTLLHKYHIGYKLSMSALGENDCFNTVFFYKKFIQL